MNKYKVYTDGAYSSSDKQGGWAFVVVVDDEKIHYNYDGVKETTNNRMEIQAALEAIKWLNNNSIKEAEIISDSQYVLKTLKGEYKKKKNLDLWVQFEDLDYSKYILTHIKGHNGDKWNEYCDMWAVHGRQLILN